MGDLGITSDMVIDAQTKDYQDSLEPKETDSEEEKERKRKKKEEFKKEMKEAAGKFIDAQIAKAEALYKSAKTTAENAIKSASTWSVQVPAMATPDPTAPKAGAASLVALKNSVSMAKAQVQEASSKVEEISTMITMFMIPVPAPLTALVSLISTANSALSVIPV